MTIEIRPVTADDHAAWLPLWQGYQHFYKAEIASATSALTWRRFLDPSEPMHAALAWQDDRAVGLVHFIYHRSCWSEGDYCYLQDLFVGAGLRGAGIGRQLIEPCPQVVADAPRTGPRACPRPRRIRGRVLGGLLTLLCSPQRNS
jgi:GNAT superfamily N-acetyltransferase